MTITSLHKQVTEATKTNINSRSTFWYKSTFAILKEIKREVDFKIKYYENEAIQNDVAYHKESEVRTIPSKDRDYYLIEAMGHEAFEKLKVVSIRSKFTYY
jgi:tRNA U34 5-carboxymethylaminomethyl modifying enzyme MnmG/GidA